MKDLKERMNSRMGILLIIGIILVVLWLLGLITSFTLGGFIHILLVIGIILVVIWLIRLLLGRRA